MTGGYVSNSVGVKFISMTSLRSIRSSNTLATRKYGRMC